MKKLLLLLFISMGALGSNVVFGQEEIELDVPAAPGTYEIIYGKVEEAFTETYWTQILYSIENMRKDHEFVYFQVTQNTTIKIYPRLFDASKEEKK